ncbi:MAG: ABC transporter substrate-binding protein [Candidatus Carbobacillus altaicus]|nr:ABC transporter substrate-binding protein [Candidatus Carbobacillus altaicus]
MPRVMYKRFIFFVLAVLSIASLVACGSGENNEIGKNVQDETQSSLSSQTASDASTKEATIEPELEGLLTFYTSQPDEDAAKLVEAFRKQYPKVNVTIFRSGTEEVVAKLRSEKLAGKVQADVLLLADAVTFEGLKQDDMLLAYASPEAENIPVAFKDPEGMYTGTKVMATVLMINTDLIQEKPDSWFVLTETPAKDQAMMPSPLYSGAAAYNLGVFTRQKDFGWEFYEALKKNGMTVGKGNGGILQAVANGDKKYGMIVDFMVARAKKDGSPVDLIYPKEGVPVITEPVAIVKTTQNQKAAKAFVDFILSETGQTLQAELGYTPIRPGVKAPEGLEEVSTLNVLEADINTLYQHRDEDKERFTQIFQ